MAKSQVFNSTAGANDGWNDVWNRSIDQVVAEINAGTTPSRSLLCNQKIKGIN
jgi:hypothetical protein